MLLGSDCIILYVIKDAAIEENFKQLRNHVSLPYQLPILFKTTNAINFKERYNNIDIVCSYVIFSALTLMQLNAPRYKLFQL